MRGRPKRYRLFVRDRETGIEHSLAFVYRNTRDSQARLWKAEGAHVVSWDVVPLPLAGLQSASWHEWGTASRCGLR